MKITTPLFDPYIGGIVNHICYVHGDIDNTFWLRATLVDAWVTGRRKSDRQLKLRIHTPTELYAPSVWLNLEPRSYIVNLDDYDAELSNDRHILMDCAVGTFIFQPPDSLPLEQFIIHAVEDNLLVRMKNKAGADEDFPVEDLVSYLNEIS